MNLKREMNQKERWNENETFPESKRTPPSKNEYTRGPARSASSKILSPIL
jgi:hypothetical protein